MRSTVSVSLLADVSCLQICKESNRLLLYAIREAGAAVSPVHIYYMRIDGEYLERVEPKSKHELANIPLVAVNELMLHIQRAKWGGMVSLAKRHASGR